MKRTLILAFSLGACSFASAQWTFYSLATGTDASFVTDITPDGQYAAGSSGNKAFRWTPGGGLQIVAGADINAGQVMISDDGQRLGGSAMGGDGKRRAAYYDTSSGVWTSLDMPAGYHATGSGNNLSSGWGMDGSGNFLATAAYDANLRYKPVIYNVSAGTYTILPSQAAGGTTAHARPNGISNDGSTVVGWDSTTSARRAAVWKNGVEVFYDSTGSSEATGATTDGSYIFGFRSNLPVVWDTAFNMTTLSLLTGFDRGATVAGTDDGRTVLGYLQNGVTPGTRRAVIWVDGTPTLLSDWALARGMNLGGFTLATGLFITPDGSTLGGWGSVTGASQAGFIMSNPVPEPATIGALILGLGALARRRRKN